MLGVGLPPGDDLMRTTRKKLAYEAYPTVHSTIEPTVERRCARHQGYEQSEYSLHDR